MDPLKALVWLAREILVKARVGTGSLFSKRPRGRTQPGNDPTFQIPDRSQRILDPTFIDRVGVRQESTMWTFRDLNRL